MTRIQSMLLMLLAALMTLNATSSGFAADEEEKKNSEGEVLSIGSKAPGLDIEHWVSNGNGKFKPVTEFEPGKVYVVEFWATWCGPCVASMPHLAELQKTYGEKGVQIVSISDEDLETVEGFLKRPVRGAPKEEDEDGEDDEKEGDDEKEEDEDAKKPLKGTYGALTSVYCLTTDPDGSSNKDYMEAAQQNGIPTSFIVGKDGLIEWIGHPMELDGPLSQIVEGKWDREEYRTLFAVQEAVQSGEIDKAVEMIAAAKKSFAEKPETIEKLERMEFIAVIQKSFQMIQEGDAEKGLAQLEEISKKAKPEELLQITSAKFQLLMATEKFELVTAELTKLTEAKDTDPEFLNQVSWSVYEVAKENKDVPKELVAAGTAAAELAVKGSPDNGMIIDTLSHFAHLAGDVDRAIKLQTEAIEKATSAPEEIQSDMKSFLKKLEKEKAKAEKPAGEKAKGSKAK